MWRRSSCNPNPEIPRSGRVYIRSLACWRRLPLIGERKTPAVLSHRHHRRAARPRPGPPRRRYGAFGGPRGQRDARGVDGLLVEDCGNIPVEQKEAWRRRCRRQVLAQIAACDTLADAWTRRCPAAACPWYWAATIPPSGGHRERRVAALSGTGQRMGYTIWLDAHADMNTPGTSRAATLTCPWPAFWEWAAPWRI
jgi:hypothetical protein